MSNKNKVSYLPQIKSRNPALITSEEILTARFQILDKIINNINSFDNEVIKYLPISIVSTFEAYFRYAFKELIDRGSPFSDNSLLILQDFKGAIADVILPLNERVHSLGELISFSFISVSSLKDIFKFLGLLLYREKQEKEKEIKKQLLAIKNNEVLPFNEKKLFKYVEKTFNNRNIFCHEAALSMEINPTEITYCYLASRSFLFRVNKFLFNARHPGSSHLGFFTQFDMNIDQQENFDRTQTYLESLITRIKSNQTREEGNRFSAVFEKWKKYRELSAKFLARDHVGGMLWQTMYFLHMKMLTDSFIKELEENFKNYSTSNFHDDSEKK
jgi:hypothetical protein